MCYLTSSFVICLEIFCPFLNWVICSYCALRVLYISCYKLFVTNVLQFWTVACLFGFLTVTSEKQKCLILIKSILLGFLFFNGCWFYVLFMKSLLNQVSQICSPIFSSRNLMILTLCCDLFRINVCAWCEVRVKEFFPWISSHSSIIY